jgi:hypothetical protein
MTLQDQLTVIDETIAKLEGRRTEIINRMDLSSRQHAVNVIVFPNRTAVVETTYSAGRHVWL